MGANPSTLLISILLPLSYVSLVNIFDLNGTDRNDRKSIKRRFAGAVLSNVLSVGITYCYLQELTNDPLREMGFRLDQLGQSIVYPIVLMTAFYFGQFVMMHFDHTLWHYIDPHEWKLCFRTMSWVRDIIVGPITEEITFRCCSAVLLRTSIGGFAALWLSPLPFAISHFHHILDDQRRGHSLAHSILRRSFQFCYTYAFGVFATYLQFTTGHALVPILAHSICNSQGLPLIHETGYYQNRMDVAVVRCSYVIGFLSFLILLRHQYGMPTP